MAPQTATLMRNTWLEEVPNLRQMIAVWRRRARGRAELARLGDRELRDIGVNRAEAWAELRKPFWQA